LRKLASADGGWSTLYCDPSDRRLWEMTYPQGDLHGGGLPVLRVIVREEAIRRYGAASIK